MANTETKAVDTYNLDTVDAVIASDVRWTQKGLYATIAASHRTLRDGIAARPFGCSVFVPKHIASHCTESAHVAVFGREAA